MCSFIKILTFQENLVQLVTCNLNHEPKCVILSLLPTLVHVFSLLYNYRPSLSTINPAPLNSDRHLHLLPKPFLTSYISEMAFVTPFLGLGIKSSTSPRTCRTPARAARWTMNEGKGFGGGEATRE